MFRELDKMYRERLGLAVLSVRVVFLYSLSVRVLRLKGEVYREQDKESLPLVHESASLLRLSIRMF